MVSIKNLEVLESLMIHPAHPVLIDLQKWFCARYSTVMFTGGYEERDYPSVHSTIPYRGMDVRSRVYENPQGVADDVNAHWQYDPERPEMLCAIYHDTGRGKHIHLQVHRRTVLRGKP